MNRNKLLVAIVAATFALSSAASFAAAGVMKLEDLTTEQRADMRSRADQLTAERAANGGHAKPVVEHAPRVKKPHARKAKTVSRL